MCEHCGCEGFGPLRELHEDHLAILAASTRLTDAVSSGNPDAVRKAVAALVAMLEPHERNEELGLYREMARGAPEYVANLLGGHEEVGRLIESSPRTGEGMAALLDAVRRLQLHIFIEEQDLFPYAIQMFTGVQWDLIEDVHAGRLEKRDSARSS